MPMAEVHLLGAWRLVFAILRVGDREEVLQHITDNMRLYLERSFFRVSSFIRQYDLSGAIASATQIRVTTTLSQPPQGTKPMPMVGGKWREVI